jgi:hypothetical protein
MTQTVFEVLGPFNVPTEKRRGGRHIPTKCPDFWQAHPQLAGRRGCYVFAIRAGRGFRPIYVGKAVKQSFGKECFATHKIGDHYNPALLDTLKGTPVLFFVALPTGRGKPNGKRVADLESFLIQLGVARNPDLSNVRGRSEKQWSIRGVVRGARGKPSASAIALKTMLHVAQA